MTRDGLGFFYGSSSMSAAKSAETAARCIQGGASWAHVLTQGLGGRKMSEGSIAACVEALRHVDVSPRLYVFPEPDRDTAVEATKRTVRIAKALGVPQVCVDVEPHNGHDWTKPLLEEIHDIIVKSGLEAEWTTPAKTAGTSHLPPGRLYLQVYERIENPENLNSALGRFADRQVVLCVATYLDATHDLKKDLEAVDMLKKSAAVWQLSTTSDAELAILREWAMKKR